MRMIASDTFRTVQCFETPSFAAIVCGLLEATTLSARAAELRPEPWAEPSAVWRNTPGVILEGDRLIFPARDPRTPQSPETLEVTIRTTHHGATHILRYRTPGCGESLDLRAAEAQLGCGLRDGTPTRPPDARVELTLDTFLEGQGYEHTRVDLSDAQLSACLAPACATATSDALKLHPSEDGHHLLVSTGTPVVVESHQIVFEITAGRLSIDTSRRGGGVYRVDQLIRCQLEGEINYRNGRLLFASSEATWAVAVDRRLNANDGTELEVRVEPAPAAWTEVDGTYRRAQDPLLQRRFDEAAPDPTTFGKDGLFWAMRRLAEQAFKRTIRYLRPSGALVEVTRREADVETGVRLVRVTFQRQAADQQGVQVAEGDIEVIGLELDGHRFKAAVRAPCRDDHAVATINGYTFKQSPEGAAPLPDAGLVSNGRVLGRLRTNPWYSNLIVDGHGQTWIENAQRFFQRHGFDPTIEHLIQGTTYLMDGRNVRVDGDNPEVNWRSGIGVAHTADSDRIFLAHTLLPATNLAALTAYGRGLTQYEMAQFMLGLGAQDALILDGGSAATFRVGDSLVSGGLRELPLCIAIERLGVVP